jgi:hypothetical protein
VTAFEDQRAEVSAVVSVFPTPPLNGGARRLTLASATLARAALVGVADLSGVLVGMPLVISAGLSAVSAARVRSVAGPGLVLLLSSGLGGAQALPLSGEFLLGAADSPLTSVALYGTGRAEWLLAGS